MLMSVHGCAVLGHLEALWRLGLLKGLFLFYFKKCYLFERDNGQSVTAPELARVLNTICKSLGSIHVLKLLLCVGCPAGHGGGRLSSFVMNAAEITCLQSEAVVLWLQV